MSVDTAISQLRAERDSLTTQLERVEAALNALVSPTPTPTRKRKAAKAPRRTSRANLTQEQAIERYGREALTCPECGKVSRAPQGMKAHLRAHSA